MAEAAIRLERERRDAQAAQVESLLRLERYADAAARLDPLVAEHPLDEQFGAQLVTALHRAGRTAAAIEQYHALRNRLVDQLGIDPSPVVQARYRELLHQEALPPAALPARDGRERASARPAQLPADVTGFTGRRAAVAELDRLLRAAAGSTAVVIAVLTGTAGVGKTASPCTGPTGYAATSRTASST